MYTYSSLSIARLNWIVQSKLVVYAKEEVVKIAEAMNRLLCEREHYDLVSKYEYKTTIIIKQYTYRGFKSKT